MYASAGLVQTMLDFLAKKQTAWVQQMHRQGGKRTMTSVVRVNGVDELLHLGGRPKPRR